MAPHRKNHSVTGFTMTDVVATIIGYTALLLALGTLFVPIVGAYLGNLQALMGAAMVSMTCTTLAIIATRLCSHGYLVGIKRISLDDLITLMIVVGAPAAWFFSLLALIVINQ